MDGNVLEKVCDPSQYSLRRATSLGAELQVIEPSLSYELADLLNARREAWAQGKVQRAEAILSALRTAGGVSARRTR
jgi:hypothetical protein